MAGIRFDVREREGLRMEQLEAYNRTFLSKAELVKKLSHLLEPEDYNKVIAAYEMAEDIHLFQSRRDNTPYFFHVTRIGKIIMNELNIIDAEIFCGAFLHDALEDSDVLNLETLTYNFGPYISYIVDVLTRFHRLKVEKESDKNLDAYLHRLRNSSIDCVIIKLAERLDNMRCLPYGLKVNPMQYIEETFQYYIPLAMHFNHPAIEKLIQLIRLEKTKYFN